MSLRNVSRFKLLTSLVLCPFSFVTTYSVIVEPLRAEPIPLKDYLKSVDRAEVDFSGRIKYNSSENSFTFYDENREPFRVTVDAGRDARERIEKECENSSFIVSYSDLCTISGSGTIEIKGSRINISIHDVEHLSH